MRSIAALVPALLLAPLAARADAGSLLAGIDTIAYVAELPDRRARDCAGNLAEVMATIRFYGRQSRLAWYAEGEARKRERGGAVPLFRVAIYPTKVVGGCMAFIHVGLSAPLAGARIAATGVPFAGRAEIWDKYYYLSGAADTFAVQVRDTAERAVKDFVAEWSDVNR